MKNRLRCVNPILAQNQPKHKEPDLNGQSFLWNITSTFRWERIFPAFQWIDDEFHQICLHCASSETAEEDLPLFTTTWSMTKINLFSRANVFLILPMINLLARGEYPHIHLGFPTPRNFRACDSGYMYYRNGNGICTMETNFQTRLFTKVAKLIDTKRGPWKRTINNCMFWAALQHE